MYKVLCLDDDEDDFRILRDLLRVLPQDPGHEMFFTEFANSVHKARALMKFDDYDLLFVDYRLKGETCLAFVRQLMDMQKHPPLILLTGMPHLSLDGEMLHWISTGELTIMHKNVLSLQTLRETVWRVMRNEFHVLVLDDEPDDFVLIREHLNLHPSTLFKVTWASTLEQAKQLVAERREHFDAFFVDYSLKAGTGLDFIHHLIDKEIHQPIILTSENESVDMDARALHLISNRRLHYLAKTNISTATLVGKLRESNAPLH